MATRWLLLASLPLVLILAASLSPGPEPQEAASEAAWPKATNVVWRGLSVAPSPRLDSTRLVNAGILETKGYPSLVLTLIGQSKGTVPLPGEVGAILLPEEEWCLRALEREEQYLGAQSIRAQLAPDPIRTRTFFASTPQKVQAAFPRYRVLMFNTTDRTAEVDLHVHLTW